MNTFFLLIVFPTLWGSLSAFVIGAKNPTLKLVHVMFRHGNRNPDSGSILPTCPYANESFYPEGFGQLTNAGKQTEYSIGNELRNRYDDFLTKTWRLNNLDPRSSNVNRTKMSLELVLGAMYPPRGDQIWSTLFWQPIPYNYVEIAVDKEIVPWAACAGHFKTGFANVTASYATYFQQRYRLLFALLAAEAGLDRSATVEDAFAYYFGFATQEELGYKLEPWTQSIYPEPIHSAAVDYYYAITNNTALRRMISGFLLKKILSDTKAKIDGTISPSERKMFLYSGHEMNVAAMLLSLNAWKIDDIPPYGAYILFEVHEIDGVWGFKLFYQNYKNSNPNPLKIPGCDEFCPYDTFLTLVEDLIPEADSECFGS